MTNKIGPNFSFELRAAGLIDPPISWGADGSIEGRERLSSDEEATLDAVIAAHDPNSATRLMVNMERERRILLPKHITLSSGKSFVADMAGGPSGTSGRDNIRHLVLTALARKAAGSQATFSFRDADNMDHDLTADEIIEIGAAIDDQVQLLHIAARRMKATYPIPSDYMRDNRWG